MTEQHCATLSNARELARRRGLPPERVLCIFSQACNGIAGLGCPMIESVPEQDVARMGQERIKLFDARKQQAIPPPRRRAYVLARSLGLQ